MTSRLDEIFSPGRLRQNWEIQTKPVLEPARSTLNRAIQAKYHELRQLVDATFPDTSRLTGRFSELTENINQLFPPEEISASVDIKQKEAIVEMLEQLEELLWALGLSREDL